MIALSFLVRILGALGTLIILALILVSAYYILSWLIIGILTALGYNNSLVVKWLRSKISLKPKK
jgi:hypothetical protein